MSKRAAPWIVEVTSQEAEGARHWTAVEISEMTELHGEDTEELAEALGPPADYQPVQIYGPYTERQARNLAEHLNEPGTQKRLGIALAIPLQLHRFLEPAGFATNH